jgi:hypothetical protein
VGRYESYAIEVLERAFGERFNRKDGLVFSFGVGAGTGEIDGTVDGRIAVEIGVGSPKQVRASVLDLVFHPYRGKLLVIVDTPGHLTERSAIQAATILARAGCSGVVYRIARDTDARLVAKDLERVISKYIEGTEQNLSRVLAINELGGAPLILDVSEDVFGTSAGPFGGTAQDGK